MRYVWIGVGVGAGLMLVAVAGLGIVLLGARLRDPSVTTHVITYRVSGTVRTARVAVEGVDEIGAPEQSVPWETTLIKRTGDGVYVAVRAMGDPGTITCEILVDGKVIESATHNGAGQRAACSSRVP